MARLYRFVKLNDRFDSHVFTFLVPGRMMQENCHEIFSKDITYGFQRWTVSFMKNDTHLSCYLKLRMNYTGVTVIIDYSLSLINRDHFTKNETFVEKSCRFTREKCIHGHKTFVCLIELQNRRFQQENGDFVVEIELRNVRTYIECVFTLDKLNHFQTNNNSYHHSKLDKIKLESSYFSIGLDDWSLLFMPFGTDNSFDNYPIVTLNRHTNFNHCSRLKYKFLFGSEETYESDMLTHNFDVSGCGPKYTLNAPIDDILRKNLKFDIRVEVYEVTSQSRATLDVTSRSKNKAHFYDRDKQAWLIESNIKGLTLSFYLYYSDISHVPRKYTRLVSWNIFVFESRNNRYVEALDGPFSKYYIQQELDEGYTIQTNIPVADVICEKSKYIDCDTGKLTVQIDWIASHLLIIPGYHRLDDVNVVQRHQMQRELLALQAENYALEKQLHIYQQSMAKRSQDHLTSQSRTDN